jgi:hypothetical protein
MAIAAMLAVAAVAIAQTPAPVLTITEARVNPASGGTPKKPRNATLYTSFTVNRESNVTADQIVFLLPQHIRLSGRGFKYCPATKINAEGTKSCPDGSKVGTGSAVAYAGSTRIDYAITIYAGSPTEIAMNLAGNVSVPALRGIISDGGETDAGGGLRFGKKITIDIPKQVQQPIGGLYSAITEVKAKLGPASGKVWARKWVRRNGKRVRVRYRKTVYFASLTGCPKTDKTHDYGVRLRYVPNPNPPVQGSSEAYIEGACGS